MFWELGKRAVVAVLLLGMLMLSPGAPQFVMAQVQPDPYEEALAKLDRFMELLEELRDQIDRTQFDVDALSFELAFEEPDTIVEWVRENIAFEQYPGLLRGPQGTLMSRAGNALDQAVLLANLLNDAGYEARVVRSTLTPQQAQSLLSELNHSIPPEPPVGDLEAIDSTLTMIANLADLPASETAGALDSLLGSPNAPEGLVELAERETALLLAHLEPQQALAASTQITDVWQTEAQDYFYVEYRMDTSEAWHFSHPVFKIVPESFLALVNAESFEGQIPVDLQHRFRFEVMIEQRLGEQVKVHSLFPAWERPAANLTGIPLTYTNVPNNLEELREQPDASVLEAATIFAPVLNGQLPASGQFFDLDGNVVDPEAASSPAAGVFQNVGNAFGNASGAIAGSENPEDYVALASQWLQFTLIAPSGHETVFRRSVVNRFNVEEPFDEDKPGAAEQTIEEAVRLLTAEHTFMLATGTIPEAFVLDSLLAKLIALRVPLEVALARQHGRVLELSDNVLAEVDLTWAGHLALYTTFDLPLPGKDRQYRHEPSLVVRTQELPIWDEVKATIDVVNNARRSYVVRDGQWSVAAPQLVRRGVWETVTEGSVLPPSQKTVNTVRVFEQAREQGIPIQVLRPEQRDQAPALDLPASARAAINRDLEYGFMVVVPERLPDNVSLAGWWRVNPVDGETLGMIGDGRGGETAEYSTLLKLISGTLLVVIGTSLCMIYVAERGKDGNNIFTCLGISTAAVMAPYNVIAGFLLGTLIAVIDIEVDFEVLELEEDCPPNSICMPPK